MNARVGIGLSLLALEGFAILYLFLPSVRKRTSGPWLIAAGVLGSILGLAVFEPPDILSVERWRLPFDHDDEVAMSLFGPRWIGLPNFLLGVGFPFLALAIRALVVGKGKELPKAD